MIEQAEVVKQTESAPAGVFDTLAGCSGVSERQRAGLAAPRVPTTAAVTPLATAAAMIAELLKNEERLRPDLAAVAAAAAPTFTPETTMEVGVSEIGELTPASLPVASTISTRSP